ncbi:MAG: YciI family protein, partial [Proteobacteria bacterium]|nr:YciI family protein [Pseudomonadota bacterium]
MKFVLICEDKPDSLDVRMATREAHLAYLKTAEVTLQLAGPMLSDDGSTMVGSMFVIEAVDLKAVQGFAEGDPYRQAGLFANTTIRPFRQVIPAPEKGYRVGGEITPAVLPHHRTYG